LIFKKLISIKARLYILYSVYCMFTQNSGYSEKISYYDVSRKREKRTEELSRRRFNIQTIQNGQSCFNVGGANKKKNK